MGTTSGYAEVAHDERVLSLVWSDGRTDELSVLWLRDNCPSGGSKLSAIRTFSVADVDPDISLVDCTLDGEALAVTYTDGHVSHFGAAELAALVAGTRPSAIQHWRSDATLPTVTFDQTSDDRGHLELLEMLISHGVGLVSGVPAASAGTEALASRLGYIRETDFGRLFDIISEPEVWELSQSSEALDPHTDDPYRYTPSGISILHCVEASADGGGMSTLVDGFAVAESIRADVPDAFETLASVSVPWVRYRAAGVEQGDAVHLRANAPVIKLDADGHLSGIRFHERSLGVIALDPQSTDRFYRALIEFARRIRSSEFVWQRGLTSGEAIVFDNQRVLHGRTAFEIATERHRRHLRLCTVDRGHVHSALRLLRSRLDSGDPLAGLPAGNLS